MDSGTFIALATCRKLEHTFMVPSFWTTSAIFPLKTTAFAVATAFLSRRLYGGLLQLRLGIIFDGDLVIFFKTLVGVLVIVKDVDTLIVFRNTGFKSLCSERRRGT